MVLFRAVDGTGTTRRKVTLIPESIGIGTLELGDKRYALLRFPTDGMELDLVVSFADLGALVAEGDRLRVAEAQR